MKYKKHIHHVFTSEAALAMATHLQNASIRYQQQCSPVSDLLAMHLIELAMPLSANWITGIPFKQKIDRKTFCAVQIAYDSGMLSHISISTVISGMKKSFSALTKPKTKKHKKRKHL